MLFISVFSVWTRNWLTSFRIHWLFPGCHLTRHGVIDLMKHLSTGLSQSDKQLSLTVNGVKKRRHFIFPNLSSGNWPMVCYNSNMPLGLHLLNCASNNWLSNEYKAICCISFKTINIVKRIWNFNKLTCIFCIFFIFAGCTFGSINETKAMEKRKIQGDESHRFFSRRK